MGQDGLGHVFLPWIIIVVGMPVLIDGFQGNSCCHGMASPRSVSVAGLLLYNHGAAVHLDLKKKSTSYGRNGLEWRKSQQNWNSRMIATRKN
jgi:hypothetical protein